MRKIDGQGSIVPLVIFFIVLIMIGLLHGLFSFMIDASESLPDIEIDTGGGTMVNVNTAMNTLMGYVWAFLVLIILIVAISWLLIMAQKERWPGGGL